MPPSPPQSAQPPRTQVFALTGGIASGKSTVASIWRASGLPVVDADQLARRAVEPGTAALAEIEKTFGSEVLLPDGSLNRKRLAELVFADAPQRERLNRIVHPEVQRLARQAFAQASQAGEPWVAYEIPLLFETGQQDHFRPVVVVATDEAQQVERAIRRDGADRAATLARIGAQVPQAQKIAEADFVIHNQGSLEELRREALRVLDEVRGR